MISPLSTNLLTSNLTAKGISSAKTKIVEADLATAIKSVGGLAGTADPAAVRAALDQRMSADVASGTLSQKDADAVNTTLDGMDPSSGATTNQAAAGASATASSAQKSGGGSGGGGGGGSATKTELSRSTVIAGSLETITITYTDGTTSSETEAATGEASAKTSTNDGPYAQKLDPGSIVDMTA